MVHAHLTWDLGEILAALARANINIVAIAQDLLERSISVVVDNDDATTGVRVTHQMLFNTDQVIEVFVIGVGGVGGALLEQLKRQQSWLKNKHIDLRVCGVATEGALLTNVYGLNLKTGRKNWRKPKSRFNLGRFNSPRERISSAEPGHCSYFQPGCGRSICRFLRAKVSTLLRRTKKANLP